MFIILKTNTNVPYNLKKKNLNDKKLILAVIYL